MTDDLARLFERAEALPHGSARVAALESIVERADPATPDNLAFRIRLDLVYSYLRAGDRMKSFVPFAWCLQQYDADPSRYAEFLHPLLWELKWQPSGFTMFPEISLAHVTDLLDDMERRYRAAGQGMHGVIGCRLRVANHVGDHDLAARLFLQWEATPRDTLSDCIGCVPSTKAVYLVSVGRHEDAVRLAEPVLQGRVSCSEQPHDLLTTLLPAYVATGRLEQAADAHRRAYAVHRSRRHDFGSIAHHVEFLARTGNEARALELVEAHLSWLEGPSVPRDDLHFSAAASRTLATIDPATEVRIGSGTEDAGVLAARLREQALALAARFDDRNATNNIGTWVHSVLDGEPWLDALPLTAEERRAAAIRASVEHQRREAPPVAPPTVEDTPVDELLALAEELWHETRGRDVDTVLTRYDALRPASERDDAEQGHYLELRGLVQLPTDPAAALEGWQQALVHVDAVGDELRARRIRARMGRALRALGRPEEADATATEALVWLADHDEPRLRVGWSMEYAQLLLDDDPAEAERRLGRARTDEHVQRPEIAAALHGEALLRTGAPDRALPAFDAAVLLARDPSVEIGLRARRGDVRRGLGDLRGAIEDFTEALAISAALDQPAHQIRIELGSTQLDAGDAFAAAEAGERVLRDLVVEQLTEWEVVPRRLMTDAYLRLSDWDQALVNARALVRLEPEDQLPRLLEQEGLILDRLQQHDEARTCFDRAIAAAAEAGQIDRQVIVLRRAAVLAEDAEDHAGADGYRGAADVLVQSDRDDLVYLRAGLASDRARSAARRGQKEAALAYFRDAEQDYLRVGAQIDADSVVLDRLDLGEKVDPITLREMFERADPRTSHWYGAGEALGGTLNLLGRTDEAEAVWALLDAQHEEGSG